MKLVQTLLLYLVLAVGVLILTGCATTQPQIVQVPVAKEKCLDYAAKPVRPGLPIKQLEKGSGIDRVLGAYAASVEALAGYSESLETLIKGCQ